MGQFDQEAWYIVILGIAKTHEFVRCRYVLATSKEDATIQANIDQPIIYDILGVIYNGQTQPTTVYQLGN